MLSFIIVIILVFIGAHFYFLVDGKNRKTMHEGIVSFFTRMRLDELERLDKYVFPHHARIKYIREIDNNYEENIEELTSWIERFM